MKIEMNVEELTVFLDFVTTLYFCDDKVDVIDLMNAKLTNLENIENG